MSELTGKTTTSGDVSTQGVWGRWVLANALAEMLGLGLSAMLFIAFALEARLGIMAAAVIVVFGSALIEGAAVGLGQWVVLRRALPQLTWRSWAVATGLGAFIAWALGMIPSTLMQLNSDAMTEPPAEVNELLMIALALLMGLVLGPILGLPQWVVLRSHVKRAGWWIPANAAAWALGMVIIFQGAGNVPEGGDTLSLVLFISLILLIAGAVVGAVHGWVLVRLLR